MKKRFLFACLILVLLLSACGGSEPAETDGSDGSPPEPVSEDGAVHALEDVQSATIQIEAQGSFADPEVGMVYNAAGRGSGFIIDPSGLAVTNNHVVTGAALIQVWVGGSDEPLNARVLGVSECCDLALIDIEGDGFPYLEWYEGDITVGTDVYAAGFPLGDPEFTLTRGIVAKASADGETPWSSVDNVIMHDATINPGNSGGPLITADGQVVGINYMGSQQTDQYFAISRDEALRVIEVLQSGNDYLSLGINGQAVVGESLSGIWVASVQSGSPADQTGIQAGDIVLTLEDLILSTDGTMSDYCDILRTHDPGDVLDIEILRFEDQQVLEGQINGRELTSSMSLAQPTQPPAPTTAPSTGGSSGTYSSYRQVTDNAGSIVIEVPSEWTQVQGGAWNDQGNIIGATIFAAPDLGQLADWTGPGVGLMISDEYDYLGGIEGMATSLYELLLRDCTFYSRQEYRAGIWYGNLDIFNSCGPGQVAMFAFVGTPEDHPGGYLAVMQFQVLDERDVDAFTHAMTHFTVIDQLP